MMMNIGWPLLILLRRGDGYWEFQNSIEYIDTGVLIVDAAEYFLQDMEVYELKYEGRVLVIDSEI